MQKVVINSSPLIVLFKSQLINILPQVCQEIIIPIELIMISTTQQQATNYQFWIDRGGNL